MRPKNDVCYREVCAIKKCSLHGSYFSESLTVISFVPEKSIRWRKVSVKKMSAIRRFHSISTHYLSYSLIKFWSSEGIALPEGSRVVLGRYNLISSLLGTGYRNISHLKPSSLKPKAKLWRNTQKSYAEFELPNLRNVRQF